MSDDKRCCPTDAPPAPCSYTPKGDDVYIAGPLDAKAGIVVIYDMFGSLPNTKRTVDDLAAKGYLVVMPDYFGDKAWKESNFPPASFEDPEWLAFFKTLRDVESHYAPTLRAIALLRQLGVQKVAALGLCWGSMLAMRLSAEKRVDAVSVAHPSFLTAEVARSIATPVCILPAVDDKDMEEVQAVVETLPVEPKFFKQYTKVRHGFLAARFNFDNPPEGEQAEHDDAFQNLLSFYEKTLH